MVGSGALEQDLRTRCSEDEKSIDTEAKIGYNDIKNHGGDDMANMIDYIDWRGDLSFEESEFNDIDNLIFAQMTMINFKGIVPPLFEEGRVSLVDAAEIYFSDDERSGCSLGLIIPTETKELFKKASESRRFGQIKLSGYVNHIDLETETQFAAMTYEIAKDRIFIAFRGTDDTIVGWKEDFNLSFLSPIPAQTEAKKYLDCVAVGFEGEIRLGGHSKGGNLAIYAAVKAEGYAKDKIVKVYNNDGPGFEREFLSSPEYEEMEDRISVILPKSSVVGMLFENRGEMFIVDSTETGLLQHNPFSWQVLGSSFVVLEQLAEDGKRISKAINDWSARLDTDTRKKFVDGVYKILVATEATTLAELNADKYAIVRALKETDKETINMVMRVFRMLFEEGGKLFRDSIVGTLTGRSGGKSAAEEVEELKTIETAFLDVEYNDEMPKSDSEGDSRIPARPIAVKGKRHVRRHRHKMNDQRFYPNGNGFVTDIAIRARNAVKKRTKR